jgi:hypothetical protein
MRKLVISALVCALFAGPASAKDFNASQKRAIEKAIKEKLIDPESARFKFPEIATTDVYCGLVNSKNRMGGYTGDAVFQVLVTPQGKSGTFVYVFGIGDADPESSTSAILLKTCSDKGYRF